MNKVLLSALSCAALSALTATFVQAQTLKEREKHAEEEATLKGEVEAVDKVCGAGLKVGIDWTGAKGADLEKYSASTYCKEALDALRHVCERSDEGKSSVAKGIKEVRCGFGSPLALALDNGQLKVTLDWETSNISEQVEKFLSEKL